MAFFPRRGSVWFFTVIVVVVVVVVNATHVEPGTTCRVVAGVVETDVVWDAAVARDTAVRARVGGAATGMIFEHSVGEIEEFPILVSHVVPAGTPGIFTASALALAGTACHFVGAIVGAVYGRQGSVEAGAAVAAFTQQTRGLS